MEDSQYHIGDWVVHVEHGVGQVKEHETRFLAGEEKDFLKVVTFTGIYWLPMHNTDVEHIRPVASSDEIDQALALMKKPPQELPDAFKEREKEISRVRDDISLDTKVKIIRDLNGRNALDGITTSEELFLIKFKKEFANELSVVREEEVDQVEEIVDNALATSVSKVLVE